MGGLSSVLLLDFVERKDLVLKELARGLMMRDLCVLCFFGTQSTGIRLEKLPISSSEL